MDGWKEGDGKGKVEGGRTREKRKGRRGRGEKGIIGIETREYFEVKEESHIGKLCGMEMGKQRSWEERGRKRKGRRGRNIGEKVEVGWKGSV